MFTPFLDQYGEGSLQRNHPEPDFFKEIEPHAVGFSSLLTTQGGNSFAEGLYRLHSPDRIATWTENTVSAFPQYQNHIVCFGYDWLGRQFALDKRIEGEQWNILMIEPGTRVAFEIPASFATFHNVEIVEYAQDALAISFFNDWIASGGRPPSPSECIGYKVPLFLSGPDQVDNLELLDMDVYWHLCAQL